MTRVVLTSVLAILLTAAAQAADTPGATLAYSGDDIAAGLGTMTIRCAQGERGLWELDLVREGRGQDILIKRFDDLTDRGEFNYAPPVGNQHSLLVIHNPSAIVAGSLTELHKGEDYYELLFTESSGTIVTTYRINAADAAGTRIVARRTLVNIVEKPLVPMPYDLMTAKMTLAVGKYDGRRRGAACTLSDYDDKGRRYHKQKDGTDAIWAVRSNLGQRRNPAFDAKGILWSEASVMKGAAAKSLGLAPGRTFRLESDIAAFYPATSVGNEELTNRTESMDGLSVTIMPREWFGSARDDHNKVGLPVEGAATKTFTLTINIAAK